VTGLRPTSDRVRETLFNWLAPAIEEARCLDLFAGSGALGFEALSRGAGAVDFVETSAIAARQLRNNIALLSADAARVHERDAYDYLAQQPGETTYDIVFLDPPFSAARYEELCTLLRDGGWLAPGALIYIERDRGQPAPDLPADWHAEKEKLAGNVRYMLVDTASDGSSR
jgi:16S rRNA (guanine966-N2)-methyltransferase